ncbi:MAG: lysophospholipid acyltransferase family protein [Planctomycetota bacterium]
MSTLRAYALSITFYTYFAISSVLFFVLALLIFVLTVPFDRGRRILHRFSCFWGYHYVWLWPLSEARFSGLENVDPKKTYVFVSNHQSLADILVLYGLFRHYKWVSKAEVFKAPFVGWNMVLNDYVRLKRGARASIASMMRACLRHLEHGSSVFLFPEGTRSPDGEIQKFRGGAISIAARANVDVLPVVLDGTGDVLPKHGLIFRETKKAIINVRVLPAISTDESGPELSDVVRERMIETLRDMRSASSAN